MLSKYILILYTDTEQLRCHAEVMERGALNDLLPSLDQISPGSDKCRSGLCPRVGPKVHPVLKFIVLQNSSISNQCSQEHQQTPLPEHEPWCKCKCAPL